MDKKLAYVIISSLHLTYQTIHLIRSNAISLKQGPKNLPLLELDEIFRTTVFSTNDSHSFGLEWIDENTRGIFPEYFKQEGEAMVPISIEKVPEETRLVPQEFMTYKSNHNYLTLIIIL